MSSPQTQHADSLEDWTLVEEKDCLPGAVAVAQAAVNPGISALNDQRVQAALRNAVIVKNLGYAAAGAAGSAVGTAAKFLGARASEVAEPVGTSILYAQFDVLTCNMRHKRARSGRQR